MEIIVAKTCGYCSGVKRAIKILDNLITKNKDNKNNKNIFTLGDIIHNPKVIKDYKEKGVYPINNSNEGKEGDVVVIRSHGAAPSVIKNLQNKNIEVINATCKFVLKVHKIAKELDAKGYFIIIIGQKNHPEVNGIIGNIKSNNFTVINSVDEIKDIIIQKKVAIISQTTQTKENFLIITKKIIEKIKDEIVIFNTICDTTEIRQNETINLASKVDVMIVVGGRNSANTTHLAQLSKKINQNTYHIESAEELNKEWFKDAKIVGISSGASTPISEILKVKNIIKSFEK